MGKNLHDVDKLFRSFLESYEEDPAENVWASIENDLNRADAEKDKAKYKFFLKAAACIALLLTSLMLNDIIQTYNYNLKRNDTSIEGLKATSSTKKNVIENKSANKKSNHAYTSKPVNANLYGFRNDTLSYNIENAGNKIFKDDKLYDQNQFLLIVLNKKNKISLPGNL